jgi:hypothetical protein
MLMKDTTTEKVNKAAAGSTQIAVCKSRMLLRNIPCEVIQVINRKKIEIMQHNPHRTLVSHSEAVYKLILQSM